MSLTPLTSRANPSYRALLALAEDRRERRKVGETLLDGEHLLEAALAAGIVPRRLIFAAGSSYQETWQQRLPEVPALLLSEALFAALSPVDSPSGVLAVIKIPQAAAVAADFIVLLEDVQDPGNLGALLRTAAAAGAGAAYLSTACADPWSPKALRGGQGAQFQIGIHERADLPEIARSRTVHAAVLGAPASLFELDLRGPVGFAFGNEGAGLSSALTVLCQPFTIPMSGRVESLNVAAAAAICLFERVRQRN